MIILCTILARPDVGRAEIRVVTGTGEHRMSDRETKDDAVRLATEQAKKQALEQVASYLESVTVVRDLDVTQDEIRSYTAGMVLVLDQQVKTHLDGEVIVIRVDLTAQVDTDEVAHAIAALKQNQEARGELLALKQEVDQLQQELEAANRALDSATSSEQVRQLSQQRHDLLDRAQSNAMVAQAWTDWVLMAPFVQPYPQGGLAQIQALLSLAGRLNPGNPHLAVAQQVVGIKAPPLPPQPPRPPVPHTVPFLPGYYVIPQPPAQPGTIQPPASTNSRQLSSVYQLNPLLPNPSGQPPVSGNSTTIIQIPAQPGIPLPQSGRSMMPTYRQVPAPNSPPASPTLHTHQPGDVGGSSSPQRPTPPHQQFHPPATRQIPPAGGTPPAPSPQHNPNRSSNQGGQ
ncbi:MAG: hypothetical protein OJF47_003203 [Nitrospira sp.]|jgi:predicted component of type VI protein secretion system|nr:MAG: hypothetical protein OJF47_003203 [Nitrospira sp.]